MEFVWMVAAEVDGLFYSWVCTTAEAAIDLQECVKHAHPRAQVVLKKVTPYAGGPFVVSDALFNKRKRSWTS